MERETGFIEGSMEIKVIPIPSHKQLAPELQVVDSVEGILDLNDSKGKSGGSCIDQEKLKIFHQRNFLHTGIKPQNTPWECFNGKIEEAISLPIPRNLNDRMKNPILKFLRAKIDPHSLEQTYLKMVAGWMIAVSACIMIDMDISLLHSLWWYNESNALSYGLKWNTRLIDTSTLREIYLFSVSSMVFLGIISATFIYLWNHLNIGKYSKIVMDYGSGTIHYHVQRNLLDLQRMGYQGIWQDVTGTLPKLIDELYVSWKIHEFDTIIFDSYLLKEESVLKKMRNMIQKLVPFGEITDLMERPLDKNISYFLELQDIQKEWLVSLDKRDSPIKKILAPLLCSDSSSSLSLVWATVYYMYKNSEFLQIITSPFMSKKGSGWNKKFTHTYGLVLKIPRERP